MAHAHAQRRTSDALQPGAERSSAAPHQERSSICPLSRQSFDSVQALAQPHELLIAGGCPPQLLATLTDRPLNRPAPSQEHAAPPETGRSQPCRSRRPERRRLRPSGSRGMRSRPTLFGVLEASIAQAIAGGEPCPAPRSRLIRKAMPQGTIRAKPEQRGGFVQALPKRQPRGAREGDPNI
jgi:hypothetical protein